MIFNTRLFQSCFPGLPKAACWNYLHDRESAVVSWARFTELLCLLQYLAEIEEINVVAHGMGNQIVLEALAHAIGGPVSRHLAELVMAAPDVDQDHYLQIATKVGAVTRGMTLCTSSADRALIASRELAGVPRAGDVGQDGPLVVEGVAAIDVTAIGSDVFSSGPFEFSSNRSLIDDLGRLVMSGSHPPHTRSVRIRRVPEGRMQPQYWLYLRDRVRVQSGEKPLTGRHNQFDPFPLPFLASLPPAAIWCGMSERHHTRVS